MKPDWKDAPEWAQWLAMDADGKWHWYECQPKWFDVVGAWLKEGNATSRHVRALARCQPSLSIEHRPLVSLMAGADTWATTTNPDARPGSEGQGVSNDQ